MYAASGMSKKARKELQDPEVLARVPAQELSVSSEFVLLISVLALRVESGWSTEAIRRALDDLRTADLVCQPEPDELRVTFPNTQTNYARVVEEWLREEVSGSVIGSLIFPGRHRVGVNQTGLDSRWLLTSPIPGMVPVAVTPYPGLRRTSGGVNLT